MNNPQSVKIIERFFQALDVLISTNVLRGIQTFTRKYDINKRNFYTSRKEPERDMFQMSWLAHMINDFGVSAQWLMTGVGGMFGNNNYPFQIKENLLNVSLKEIESYFDKNVLVTYIPSKRQRTVQGIAKSIKLDKLPVLEIEEEQDKIQLIPIYSITKIEEDKL